MKAGLKLLAIGLTMLASSTAWAQYPDRPITMIVPFPPGGVTDTVARPIADALGKELGQSVVVENKAGAGGAIGTGEAAHAKPDGYRSEEHTSELQSLMRNSYAVLCLKKKSQHNINHNLH